jgi:phosphate starvation-inducible PhoH-like protein
LRESIKSINIDLAVFFGTANVNFNYLVKSFPKLKLIARGDEIKIAGSDEQIDFFETIIDKLLEFYNRYNRLNLDDIKSIIIGDEKFESNENINDLILYGNYGKAIKALSPNQKKIFTESEKKDMIFAVGPAGTGKTYTAIALAVRALKNKEIKKIILTRPAVEAGEQLGYLPGDLKEKLDPYLQPLYDALYDMIPIKKLESFFEERIIEIAPLAFMRGRTLDNAFVILDEAQNATFGQLKMFLTRMGKNAKFIITGDLTQIDLPKNNSSGLNDIIEKLKDIKEISFVELNQSDIVRHNLVKKIVKALE